MRTVLLVDDDPVVLMLLAALLGAEGWQVAEAATLADAERAVLIGAWAVGPQAGAWIHHASLAIRAQLPLEILRDQIAQFPTYHEAYQAALEQLEV